MQSVVAFSYKKQVNKKLENIAQLLIFYCKFLEIILELWLGKAPEFLW